MSAVPTTLGYRKGDLKITDDGVSKKSNPGKKVTVTESPTADLVDPETV